MKLRLVTLSLIVAMMAPCLSFAADKTSCEQLEKVQADLAKLQSSPVGVSGDCERNANEAGECTAEEKEILKTRSTDEQQLFSRESELQSACGY